MAKWFFGRSLATGFLTRIWRLLCSVAERWPVQPTSTPAPPSPKCASLVMEAWGTRVAVSWVQALAARLVPSLVSSLLVLGLVPGLVSSVIATLAPLRHASNLGGPFNLCSLLSAVSLAPLAGATTHESFPVTIPIR